MKKELKYMVYLHLLVLGILVYLTFDLLTLAVDDTSQDALLDSDLNSPEEWGNRPELIPRIIHQTYKTEEVPEQWREGQAQCIYLHPDYKYMFWSDAKARDFIENEYPWFLDTFDGYKYPIERADAIRYFILLHFGGIYIDLDDGCKRKLDPLLAFPAFVRKTSPTGISNDVMGSQPNHPFFTQVINSLKKYDRNWVVPYITIMFSTGPLFLSVIWKQYKRWGVPEGGEVRILQPAEYKLLDSAFFHISAGSSWHSDDANFIKIMANHILACVVLGFIIGFVVLYLEYCIYTWLSAGGGPRSFVKRIYRGFTWSGSSSSNGCYMPTSSSETGAMQRTRRNRKDSNLPVHVVLTDLEKQDPNFMDLSSSTT